MTNSELLKVIAGSLNIDNSNVKESLDGTARMTVEVMVNNTRHEITVRTDHSSE